MNHRQILIRRAGSVAAVLALVGAVAYVSLQTGPLAPVRVTVTRPAVGSIMPDIFGVGTVEARRGWMLGPTVAGRVLQVHVDVGDAVKAGEVLAEMDPVDLDQRLAALDASLARAASSQLSAQAQVQDAAARRALATAVLQRNRELAQQSFISATALEARVQEQASAEAAIQAAQANLSGARQDQVRLAAERAALLQQRSKLRLIAPADGVITARDAEAGSTVVAGQAVLRMIDPASLWVKLRVDQGRSAGLARDLPAHIVLRSQPEAALPGRVARLDLLADSVTEERIVQVAFDQTPPSASVGEMAEVRLQLPTTQAALLLPNAAVQRQQGQIGVWRLQDDRPEFVPVTLGARSLDGQVQVLQGLSQDDRVVIHSSAALAADSRVKVQEVLVKTGDKL